MQNQFTAAIAALIAIAADEEAAMSIDEARGIIARAVEAELTEMDADFDAADLGDWLAAGQFSGNETAVSIAREYAAPQRSIEMIEEVETCEDCGMELTDIGCPLCDEVVSDPYVECEECGATLDIMFGCMVCQEL